ncbi:glycoside hydrolase family 97 protein [Catenovulum sp. 2E275]|uniref:glycoside hydrolase family 97 protein n=1 Tax=Catenovulum sp. 2E275 TaxID=2980497 RepID=UPI0021D2053C|nr:glycoside hydrolase family 97 protein [Catenovulum sp. 2E275]MCU4676449.1 glycoside hydrolase family 97 protein [Catenovulum sp. 2E275]
MMKKLVLTIAATAIISGCSQNQTGAISSPDNQLQVKLNFEDNQLVYSVYRNNQLIIENSDLGLIFEDRSFDKNLKIIAQSPVQPIHDEYHLYSAKVSHIQYDANEQTITLENSDKQQLDIKFRVSNDGVAFKYIVKGNASEQVTLLDEITEFDFSMDSKAWIQPVAEAQTGWSNTNPSYEEHYLMEAAVDTPSPTKAGWVFPALFNVKNENTWVAITEAGITAHNHASRLAPTSPDGAYEIDKPMAAEVFTNGALMGHSNLPFSTPWRVLAIGDLKTVSESTIGTDLAEPNKLTNTDFIKPGISSWSWGLLKDDFTVFPVQKTFIDHAADMKWQYTLVDADWDQKIGEEKLAELAQYANSKGVGLLVWYNSSGDWNKTPYTPKHTLLTQQDRQAEFAKLKAMGIKGVKIDFFAGDGQSMIEYYHDILQDAAKAELLVNFHGATLPRGLHRTYPNLMTAEAVHGFEMVTFFQKTADLAASHSAVLPFTRNLFDPMDYTPTTFNPLANNIQRKTTNGLQLAQSILFVSGIQHIVETPDGMKNAPYYAKQLLQEIPASWDESVFIDGYPGKLAVFARRSGDNWYIAALNGENKSKELNLDLSQFAGKKASIIATGKGQANLVQYPIELSSETKIPLLANDGFVIKL